MTIRIGDSVIYLERDIPGGFMKGEIADSGVYVQFTPRNLKWSKVKEPVF